MRKALTTVSLFVLAFLAGPVIAWAEAAKDLPLPTNYVSDFANVLTPETKQQVNQLCAQVDHQAHAQIAVVTIKTLDDVPIQDFSVQLWDKWKIGQKDRGVLILLAVQDHKRWITTGYGLEAILPDSRVGDIGRQMVPYLRTGDYDDAVSVAVGQISQIIARDAGVTLQPLQMRGPPRQQAIRLSLGAADYFRSCYFPGHFVSGAGRRFGVARVSAGDVSWRRWAWRLGRRRWWWRRRRVWRIWRWQYRWRWRWWRLVEGFGYWTESCSLWMNNTGCKRRICP